MIDILSYLPAKRKNTSSGWLCFDAPCCVHNGETQDRRQRGGLIVNDRGWSYHCFNCEFTTGFQLGSPLSFKARRLLQWLNVPQEEIERFNLESLKHRSLEGLIDDRRHHTEKFFKIEFEDRDLPDGCVSIDSADNKVLQYLESRQVPLDYPYLFSPRPRPAIIIPFTYQGQIVGSTRRFLDDRVPKYIHDMQHGYVFGIDLQRHNWQHVLVVEGVFDALSISGMAVLHADVNDAQVRLIRSLGREVTVVPDHDEAGMKLVDRAVELGWAVSIPNWPNDVKDVNDAVRCYGKAATMLSIFQARNTSKIKIEMAKKVLLRKIHV